MDRRNFLGLAATVSAGALLSACGGSTTPGTDPNLSKAQAIVTAISGTMDPLIANLTSIPGVTSTTLSGWQALAAQVTAAASGVLSAVSTSAGTGAATMFGNVVNSLLLSVGSSGVLPASVQNIITDIQAVLPIALVIFQVAMAVAAPKSLMMKDPDAALLELQAIAR